MTKYRRYPPGTDGRSRNGRETQASGGQDETGPEELEMTVGVRVFHLSATRRHGDTATQRHSDTATPIWCSIGSLFNLVESDHGCVLEVSCYEDIDPTFRVFLITLSLVLTAWFRFFTIMSQFGKLSQRSTECDKKIKNQTIFLPLSIHALVIIVINNKGGKRLRKSHSKKKKKIIKLSYLPALKQVVVNKNLVLVVILRVPHK